MIEYRAGYVARMREGSPFEILAGKSTRKRSLGRPRLGTLSRYCIFIELASLLSPVYAYFKIYILFVDN